MTKLREASMNGRAVSLWRVWMLWVAGFLTGGEGFVGWVMDLPVLYVKPGCPWCVEVIDYLARKKIAVRKVVVSGNPEGMREMMELSGQTKAPTLDWHGEVLADFGVDELVPFLKRQGA